MVLWILLCQINFGSFLMVPARSIILATIFSTATSSTMEIHTLDSPAMSTKLFGYFALTCLCWYSCRCWLTTSIAARVHVVLALRLKLKLYEDLCWYLQVYGLVLFSCLLKNTRLYHRRRKNLKTSKICSFFRLYFVIAGDSLCISTMYYLLL
jgi:hypothetical protein